MASRLTSTMRRVLTNLHTGKPMWDGVAVANPGSGVPSVTQSLIKRGLITRSLELTFSGREEAQKAST